MSQNHSLPKKQDRFPRTAELPNQSPLFRVGQKDRYLRQLLIEDIEEQTGRRFVAYFANRYEPDSGIEPADVAYMVELLGDVGSEPVDILIETMAVRLMRR